MLDSVPNFGAGPGAGPKSFEILKFDDLTVFKVFGDMNGVGVKYSYISDGNNCLLILLRFVIC